MESRKQKEIEYYDEKSAQWLRKISEKDFLSDFEGFNPHLLNSYAFLYRLIKDYTKDKIVLDYGCGNGVHAGAFVKAGARKIIGIDLSEKSLEIAERKMEKEIKNGKVEFLKMDCENLDFSENCFDIIFDGGSFCSLDLQKAFPEILRVLKPDGIFIGIETLGHNPITNFKRKINKLVGKRTEWAIAHIFKMDDAKKIGEYFQKSEFSFFHPISYLTFPFLNLPGGEFLLRLFEKIDKIFLRFQSFQKYAFKIVFVFSGPKK